MFAPIQAATRAAIKWPKLAFAAGWALVFALAKDRWLHGINQFIDDEFGAAVTAYLAGFLQSPYAIPATIFVLIMGSVFLHAYFFAGSPEQPPQVPSEISGDADEPKAQDKSEGGANNRAGDVTMIGGSIRGGDGGSGGDGGAAMLKGGDGGGAFARPSKLTTDQIQFRVALKQFALTYPAQLYDAVSRVRVVLVRKVKQNGDQDYSYAFHHAMHFAWSAGNANLTRLTELASVDSSQIEIDALQNSLEAFGNDYEWEQKFVANLNALVKVNLEPLPETRGWLAVDKAYWDEFRKLKIWPEATILKGPIDRQMASKVANWTTPIRVNF